MKYELATEDALPDQRLDPMLDEARIAPVDEAFREMAHQTDPRSTCRNSSASAFEVIVPPSKLATTARLSTASNSNRSGVHFVCIGGVRNQITRCRS